jgi:hypothetical protein
MGSVDEGFRFFDRFWPEARAVSDPDKFFYRAFALNRGSLRQMLGPSVWRKGLEATRKGNTIGMPIGDVRQMSGAFLVQKDAVLWQHDYRHSGDHPEFSRIPEMLATAS